MTASCLSRLPPRPSSELQVMITRAGTPCRQGPRAGGDPVQAGTRTGHRAWAALPHDRFLDSHPSFGRTSLFQIPWMGSLSHVFQGRWDPGCAWVRNALLPGKGQREGNRQSTCPLGGAQIARQVARSTDTVPLSLITSQKDNSWTECTDRLNRS